jgi:hypothetical protein
MTNLDKYILRAERAERKAFIELAAAHFRELEASYRRGFDQGYAAALEAVWSIHKVDLWTIKQWKHRTLTQWRYARSPFNRPQVIEPPLFGAKKK